jgi:hypothetical protein
MLFLCCHLALWDAAGQQDVASSAVCFVLQGVLDLSGSSPRRYLFQVLSHFTSNPMQQERLRYFASAEGRDDLYRSALTWQWQLAGLTVGLTTCFTMCGVSPSDLYAC